MARRGGRVHQRSRCGQQLAGLEQRLESGEDHRPAAVQLLVRALTKLVVGHRQMAGVADRLDLPCHPRGAFALHVLVPQGPHALDQSARRVDLEILPFSQKRVAAWVTLLVASADLPIRLDARAEVVLASHLAVGDRLPEALRGGLDVDLEDFLHRSFSNSFLRSTSAETWRSVYLSIHRSWINRIGTGLR